MPLTCLALTRPDPFGRPGVDPIGRPKADPFGRPHADPLPRPITLQAVQEIGLNQAVKRAIILPSAIIPREQLGRLLDVDCKIRNPG
jgi:hypothetical protein